MEITLKDKIYKVEIIKKNNRNTYIRVKNGVIVATTNYLCTKKQIEKLIKDNEQSILKMIEKDEKSQNKQDKFYYFGKKYDVIYGFNNIEFTKDKIFVKNNEILEKYLKKEITRIYQERLNYWYNLFEENIPIPNLKIRKMTTRWGVCNIKNHNITLNYNLINYDISCLDYVVVHELSHLIHPNHSKKFWFVVEKYYPNYKQIRKTLKE